MDTFYLKWFYFICFCPLFYSIIIFRVKEHQTTTGGNGGNFSTKNENNISLKDDNLNGNLNKSENMPESNMDNYYNNDYEMKKSQIPMNKKESYNSLFKSAFFQLFF